MMKLNNKGFAISTMLYGILAMIILILYLILSIMNNSLYTKKQIVDDEEKYINKCATRQVALEKCYKIYNLGDAPFSCSDEYDAYTSCMGYEANSTYSAATASIKDVVLDYNDIYSINNPNGTLAYDEASSTPRYVFIGSTPNNYIKIGSKTGRILSIENTGIVKVIMLDPVQSTIDTISGDSLTIPDEASAEVYRWNRSVAYNKLENTYSTLDYTNKMVDSMFNYGIIYPNPTNAQSLLEMYEDNAIAKQSKAFGTISMEDYLKASSNAHDHKYNCKESGSPKFKLSTLSDSSKKCNQENWINDLSDGTHDVIWTSTAAASNMNSYYVINGNSVQTAGYNTKHWLFLVVNLSSKLTVNTSGTGTKTNPYVISLK